MHFIRQIVVATLLLTASASAAHASSVLFKSTPSPVPGNLDSYGYQAYSIRELGDIISLAGSGSTYNLDQFIVTMSNWALQSNWPSIGTSAGYSADFTLNLYNVGPGNTVGSLISSTTTTALIPWRPEADPNCPGGKYKAADGVCYNGSLSEVTFDLQGLTTPKDIIWGLAFNTQSAGYSPTGVSAPSNSLNLAMGESPSVGSDPLPDSAYVTTTYPGWNTGGVFREDAGGWSPYVPAAEVTGDEAIATVAAEVPEPASLTLFGVGLLGLVRLVRKRVAA